MTIVGIVGIEGEAKGRAFIARLPRIGRYLAFQPWISYECWRGHSAQSCVHWRNAML